MTHAVRQDGTYFRPVSAYIEPQAIAWPIAIPNYYEILPLILPVDTPVPASLTDVSRRIEKVATTPSVAYAPGARDHIKARFRMLRHLPSNYDGQGARTPNPATIDAAISFVDRIKNAPSFTATLDDDGSAVIEFENRATAFFADITFREGGAVEVYKRQGNDHSEFLEGQLASANVRRFLETYIDLAL